VVNKRKSVTIYDGSSKQNKNRTCANLLLSQGKVGCRRSLLPFADRGETHSIVLLILTINSAERKKECSNHPAVVVT